MACGQFTLAFSQAISDHGAPAASFTIPQLTAQLFFAGDPVDLTYRLPIYVFCFIAAAINVVPACYPDPAALALICPIFSEKVTRAYDSQPYLAGSTLLGKGFYEVVVVPDDDEPIASVGAKHVGAVGSIERVVVAGDVDRTHGIVIVSDRPNRGTVGCSVGPILKTFDSSASESNVIGGDVYTDARAPRGVRIRTSKEIPLEGQGYTGRVHDESVARTETTDDRIAPDRSAGDHAIPALARNGATAGLRNGKMN